MGRRACVWVGGWVGGAWGGLTDGWVWADGRVHACVCVLASVADDSRLVSGRLPAVHAFSGSLQGPRQGL